MYSRITDEEKLLLIESLCELTQNAGSRAFQTSEAIDEKKPE